MKERVPNHFLAYYRLDVRRNCCTNNPFPIRPEECAGEKQASTVDVERRPYKPELSTIACSNSTYP